MQPAFSEKVFSPDVNLKFLKFNGFESVRNLENILLAFDDLCEDTYVDNALTIDLKFSHIILFKSPQDVQQLDLLRRQLNVSKFLGSCCELATRDSFGHLLINLDPHTSDCLRYCSNTTRPGPAVFLPVTKAENTPITNEKRKTYLLCGIWYN